MFESPLESEAKTLRSRSIKIVGITAVVFVLIIGAVLYVSQQGGSGWSPGLEPYRAGSPEFDSYQQFIEIEQRDPQGSENLLGQMIVVGRAILRNQGHRTLTQVEVRAVVYDAAGKELADRLALPVPRVRKQLEPGEAMLVQVNVDTVPAGANPTAVTVFLNGLRFKESNQ